MQCVRRSLVAFLFSLQSKYTIFNLHAVFWPAHFEFSFSVYIRSIRKVKFNVAIYKWRKGQHWVTWDSSRTWESDRRVQEDQQKIIICRTTLDYLDQNKALWIKIYGSECYKLDSNLNFFMLNYYFWKWAFINGNPPDVKMSPAFSIHATLQ